MRPLIQPSHSSVTHVIWEGERMTVADYCARKALPRIQVGSVTNATIRAFADRLVENDQTVLERKDLLV